MSAAHTPGPWFAEHRKAANADGYSTEIFTADDGTGHGTIATLAWYPRPMDEFGRIGTYREANARLIASAPDLLEALEQCNAVLTALTSGTPDPSGSDIMTHYQMCVEAELASRKAIRKASPISGKGSQ